MRKNFILWCLLMFVGSSVFAQGIVFEQGTWNEVLAKAKAENKVLFVDVYTSWCAPCKLVAKNVFPQEKVGNYYNQHFINYQLDGEKGNGPDIVKKYKIQGYPTFLYVNGEGELMYQFSGAKDVKGFLEEAEKVSVCSKYGGWEKFQADYKAGRKDADFLKDYYDLVADNLKPEVLNKYLMSLPDERLCSEETGKILENNIKLYDYDVLNRMVEVRVKMGEQSADFDFMFTFPLQWKLTGLFNESIDNGNEAQFKELLTLKKKLSVLPRSQDLDINLILGRGLFFVSEDLLNLCYWWKNGNDDAQFRKTLEVYMDQLMKDNPLDTLASRRKGTEDMIKQTPELLSFMGSSLKEGQKEIASYIIDFTDYYWRMMPSDKATRERCATWVNYACRLNPYIVQTPLKAANLLVRLGHTKEAVRHLETAIEKQKFLQGEHPEKLHELYQKEFNKSFRLLNNELRDVRNGKEGK